MAPGAGTADDCGGGAEDQAPLVEGWADGGGGGAEDQAPLVNDWAGGGGGGGAVCQVGQAPRVEG